MMTSILAAIIGIVTQVHDGDTMRLADGTRIRLSGIDANEMNGTCHSACAPMSAKASRDNLSRIALGKRVVCEPTGMSYRRVTAWCSVGGIVRRIDLSCEQVRSGAGVRWRRYDPDGRLKRCER